MSQRIQEEQLRELQKMNSQLNPGPALLKFLLLIAAVLFLVFGLFAIFVALPAQGGRNSFFAPPATHR